MYFDYAELYEYQWNSLVNFSAIALIFLFDFLMVRKIRNCIIWFNCCSKTYMKIQGLVHILCIRLHYLHLTSYGAMGRSNCGYVLQLIIAPWELFFVLFFH